MCALFPDESTNTILRCTRSITRLLQYFTAIKRRTTRSPWHIFCPHKALKRNNSSKHTLLPEEVPVPTQYHTLPPVSSLRSSDSFCSQPGQDFSAQNNFGYFTKFLDESKWRNWEIPARPRVPPLVSELWLLQS